MTVITHTNFFKKIGKKPEISMWFFYYFLGLIGYPIVYFYFRAQIKEEKKLIKEVSRDI